MKIIQQADVLQTSEESFVYIDVRTKSAEFNTGKEAYEHNHIPNAVYLDVKTDLSGKDEFLPDTEKLTNKLGALGIDENTKLVIYDQGNQRSASRAWYVFHYLGHKYVYILQGGYPSWTASDGTVTKVIPNRKPVTYIPTIQPAVKTTIQEVKEKLLVDGTTLVDARAPERYEGIEEPKYHKAGHIPGAVNYHAKNVFSTTGSWKTKQELKENFAGLNQDDEVIVSCGSGNSACMNLVALKEAGYKHVSLFAGGFSEWISDEENEVAAGKKSKHHEK